MRRRVTKAVAGPPGELDRLRRFCPYDWLPEGTELNDDDDADELGMTAMRDWLDACAAWQTVHGPLPAREAAVVGARWWGLTMDRLSWHANGHRVHEAGR